MKRTSKTEKQIADQRLEENERARRTARKRTYTEEELGPTKSAADHTYKWEKEPKPLRTDADPLDVAVHQLEIENFARRKCGKAPLSYGQWSMQRGGWSKIMDRMISQKNAKTKKKKREEKPAEEAEECANELGKGA
jgi:hypothetical protein